MAKQRTGSQDKLKNIFGSQKSALKGQNQRVKDPKVKVRKYNNRELHVIMKIFSKFVRLYRIHYIDITKVDNKEVLNLILLEYLNAKDKTRHNNRR
jgi:hypothetical protein